MPKDFQEDRHGVDREHYKRGTKYKEEFDNEDLDLKIKIVSPDGEVSEVDIGCVELLVSFAYDITEGKLGDKWTFEIVKQGLWSNGWAHGYEPCLCRFDSCQSHHDRVVQRLNASLLNWGESQCVFESHLCRKVDVIENYIGKRKMNKNLIEKLSREFPSYFESLKHIECGDGWYDIIFNACRKLKMIEVKDFKFLQIKEKFGTLRIYYTPYTDDTKMIMSSAEHESNSTCERCGTKENVTQEGGWVKTLCLTCRERRWDV